MSASHDTVQPTGHAAWTGQSPTGPVAAVRGEAAARFHALGWPTTAMESWKYTSLKKVRDTTLAFDGSPDPEGLDALVDARRLPDAWAELVFVDGRLDEARSRRPEHAALSVDPSSRFGDLAPWHDDALAAFNTAWVQDGLRIDVPAGVSLPGPIHLLHVTAGEATASLRHVIVLGRSASATVVESWLDTARDQGTTTVAGVEIDVGDGATLDHVVDAPGTAEGRLLRAVWARIGRDAVWRCTAAWTGGQLVRAEHHVTLAAPGALAELDAVVTLAGRDHVDQHNVFTHAAPHGTSRMRSKAVAGGRARTVFDGTVIVREGAQKTDARQDSRNLLLSERAEADAKPRLEIYADDVACAHGATVGRLDESALTYLRTRGVPAAQGRRMLTEAFVADRIQAVRDPSIRGWLSASVEDRLSAVLDTRDGEVS